MTKTWQAKCWTGRSYATLQVQADSNTDAERQLKNIYGATEIIGLTTVGSDGVAHDPGVVCAGALVLIIVAIFLLPWVLMIAGGTAGTWIGQKVTNQTLDEYNNVKEPNKDQNRKVMIVFALICSLATTGFVVGDNVKQNVFNNIDTNVEQVSE